MDKFIRDNVHGDIYIKEVVIKQLIDTKEFQRLRRIIQLGGGQFVFPGANHTRFSHCIGVYCVINKFLANEKISNAISENEALVVQIAGLLHDIGHGPFSHTFESISSQEHEQYTIDIILGNTEINQVLKLNNIDPKEVAAIIEGKHKNNILNLLVSSQLDADRLDYLLRDSVNTGVDYANLDIEWIIRNASIFNNKMVFKMKTLNALEHYLLGRYYMFKQIYNHKVSQAFDITFKNWFTRIRDLYLDGFKFKNQFMIDTLIDLIEQRPCDLERYNRLDDYTMIEFIKSTISEEDKILSKLSEMIINRRFLKISDEISEKQFEQLKNNYNNEEQKYYFTEFKTEKFNIYKTNNSKKDESIYLLKDEQLFEITEISEILNISSKNIKKNVFVFINDNVK